MYKSPEAVVLSSLFSLEDSSINLATNSPVVTLNTWVVLLQPVAMNLPSLENLTQQTTDEWSKEWTMSISKSLENAGLYNT